MTATMSPAVSSRDSASMDLTLRDPAASSSDTPLTGLELMAHLFRRAGFGATRAELEAALKRGYEAVVEELIHPESVPPMDLELIYRHLPDARSGLTPTGGQTRWLYRMINTTRPLEEKMTLFWHGLFATSLSKSKVWEVSAQIDMLNRHALSDFRTLLLQISKDPAMLYWLDNQENTNKVRNENYGRELLELFSMGIGNYSETDVRECARAFSGWTIRGITKSNGGVGAFLSYPRTFEFRRDLHDDGEKTFLGHTGRFNGDDIIDIIVKQPATARFVARRLYDFFVSDTPDDAAIGVLADVFVRTGGDTREVLRTLFLSDFFRSPTLFGKVKSPVEHVVGLLHLTGGFDVPAPGAHDLVRAIGYMGQDLLNPPSVEGWHTGQEWIDSGLLVERVNWAVAQLGDLDRPGLRDISGRIRARGDLTPEQLVSACLELIGPLRVTPRTREILDDFAAGAGPLTSGSGDEGANTRRIGLVLQAIAATREFQFV